MGGGQEMGLGGTDTVCPHRVGSGVGGRHSPGPHTRRQGARLKQPGSRLPRPLPIHMGSQGERWASRGDTDLASQWQTKQTPPRGTAGCGCPPLKGPRSRRKALLTLCLPHAESPPRPERGSSGQPSLGSPTSNAGSKSAELLQVWFHPRCRLRAKRTTAWLLDSHGWQHPKGNKETLMAEGTLAKLSSAGRATLGVTFQIYHSRWRKPAFPSSKTTEPAHNSKGWVAELKPGTSLAGFGQK